MNSDCFSPERERQRAHSNHKGIRKGDFGIILQKNRHAGCWKKPELKSHRSGTEPLLGLSLAG